jgi:hypothetical protein
VNAFKKVNEQTHELCVSAIVNSNGLAFKYVKDKTDELAELAVQLNGNVLQDVKHQTPKIIELAVRQRWDALLYVDDDKKTIEICKIAVEQSLEAYDFVPREYLTFK